MSDNRRPEKISLEERVKAEDLLYAGMFHSGDRKIFSWGLGIAVALHIILLVVPLPEFETTLAPEANKNVIKVRKYVPPPPKIERRQVAKKQLTRKVPIPDPTPDEPEPIREPEPDIEPDILPPDAEFIIGDPEPPPPSGPLIAGVGGVTNPKRIESCYVKPVYPELARRARLEGKVYLQAIVKKDGSVDEITVLRCTKPGLGFEEAAIDAVNQWCYEPATQGTNPVEVYFTINVDFTIQ